jgi:hypothetical protein
MIVGERIPPNIALFTSICAVRAAARPAFGSLRVVERSLGANVRRHAHVVSRGCQPPNEALNAAPRRWTTSGLCSAGVGHRHFSRVENVVANTHHDKKRHHRSYKVEQAGSRRRWHGFWRRLRRDWTRSGGRFGGRLRALCRGNIDQRMQGPDKELKVRTPSRMGQLHGIAISEIMEVFRQGLDLGHFGTAHQNGYYRDVATLERCGRLQAYEVGRVLKAPLTRLVSRIGPVSPDDRQKHATVIQALPDLIPEVATWFNDRYIHEDRLFTELSGQVVVQTSGLALGVVSSVADEDGSDGKPPNTLTLSDLFGTVHPFRSRVKDLNRCRLR